MITNDETLEMASASVADIALRFPQGLEILNRYNLDYCCNGKKPFLQVCAKANLNAEAIWNEILEKKEAPGADQRMKFDTWEPSLLIDFIVQHHHRYVRESIPQLQELLNKVCLVHGNDQPELLEIRNDFNAMADELLNHLPKEEEFLFPAIKRITKQNVVPAESPLLSTDLQAPLSLMEHEHETVGDFVKSIRSLTNKYSPPEFACTTYQLTYKLLQEFDNDLMQHIHLENNILFPKIKIPLN